MMIRHFLMTAIALLWMTAVSAQVTALISGKKKLLKGQWQLVKTHTQGIAHPVAKNEYDAVVTFKPCHRYTEEVTYEGYHWIIKARWKVYRRNNKMDITHRKYVSGSEKDVPEDIHFVLSQLYKDHWVADTETKIEKVKMEYHRIPKKVRK